MQSSVRAQHTSEDTLALEQQLVRLEALLEASRAVHASLDLRAVLEQAARIAVLELELDAAWFTEPGVGYSRRGHAFFPVQSGLEGLQQAGRLELQSRDGRSLSALHYQVRPERELTGEELDFLEGLALQTSLAFENAVHHHERLQWARIERDLDAARLIQQSLLPQALPELPGYSVAARTRACYQVGGDYLDVVEEPDGKILMLVADVAGKGLASALIAASFRSAFRALARQQLPLAELATRLAQQHWDEGEEARRRYVTAIFCRLDPASRAIGVVNAGHNPGLLLVPQLSAPGFGQQWVKASAPPLGLFPGLHYREEQYVLPPAARLLLYTDGLTEAVCDDQEFGQQRLADSFAQAPGSSTAALDAIWGEVDGFTCGGPQADDMSAVALMVAPSAATELA